MRAKGIEWNFSPPSTSHAGGICERMTRSVRKHLHALVGNRLVDDETLLTVSCETAKIVNDRPLTWHYDNHQDPSVLMPNTLLICYRNPCSPAGDLPMVHYPRLSEQWELAQTMADMFWARWIKEYVPTLQERQNGSASNAF